MSLFNVLADRLKTIGIKGYQVKNVYKAVEKLASALPYHAKNLYMNKNANLRTPQMILRSGDQLHNVDIDSSLDVLTIMQLPESERKFDIWMFQASEDWSGAEYNGKLYDKKEDAVKVVTDSGLMGADLQHALSSIIERNTPKGKVKFVAMPVDVEPSETITMLPIPPDPKTV